MPIYRNKITGKIVEVLKGTRLPRTFEEVKAEGPEKPLKVVVKCTKRAKSVKKMQKSANLCKKEGNDDEK